jgi:hypothetical protein
MKAVSVLSCVALGASLAAACGGIATVDNGLAGDDAGESESESGATPRSDAGAVRAEAGATPGMPMINVSCEGAQSCPRSQVCCAMLSLGGGGAGGVDVACAASCGLGGFQVCMISAECTTSGEVCMASPLGLGSFCTAARDAGPRVVMDSGAGEDGNAHDASDVADGNAHDSSNIEDGNAHDAELVDAAAAMEAASGQDAAGDDAGDAGEAIPVDDGAADDDSSDAGDGGP